MGGARYGVAVVWTLDADGYDDAVEKAQDIIGQVMPVHEARLEVVWAAPHEVDRSEVGPQ